MSKHKSSAKAVDTAKDTTQKLMPNGAKVDPVLASLFASSSGPVAPPVKNVPTPKTRKDTALQINGGDQEDEFENSTSPETSELEEEVQQKPDSRPRKRRRLSQEDDIETSYFNRLAREEEKEDMELKISSAADNLRKEDKDSDDTASSASNDLEDLSDLEPEDAIPRHESLTKPTTEYEKTRRTVFLSNVSIEAIKSKIARRELESHLKSVLDTEAKETIESLRFRSTAFDITAGPRKAAYAKKELMDDTTKSTNVYVVFSLETAAKKVAKKLNGTVVLDRHLHTDWLAHPNVVDHKRCVFVGNLNFVDVESNVDTTEKGEKQQRRPKAREPADAEEGLWRAFGKCGTVESVRVVRDKATRVGKGFAYVQFDDEVAAEKALALDGKKFPPMLPRLLRVSRAKRVLKKDLKRKRDENEDPKNRKNVSGMRKRDGASGLRKKKLDGVVFEGYRASSEKGMKFKTQGKKKSKNGVRPTGRSSKRGAVFKASGGKKKRDMK